MTHVLGCAARERVTCDVGEGVTHARRHGARAVAWPQAKSAAQSARAAMELELRASLCVGGGGGRIQVGGRGIAKQRLLSAL